MTSEAGGITETWTEPVPLTLAQQKEFVRLVSQGASPAAVCSQLGVSLESARLTMERDARFRRHMKPVPQTLGENVRAAMYLKAMKGTVSAQTFWLKEEAAHDAAGEDEIPVTPRELIEKLDRVRKVLAEDFPGEVCE
ncbi:hypothetical protein Pan44_02390 [Caulifigura coniformis]|uniref:Uncharacterized protein n=1 Tax=Caulifigura coniformis TaxID=2527983 RepID=A0A517S7Y2_9PLAN|nr:hypothetical protein [Caulifigura coniformis]QDT52230.1 hypothetical protein Pan44_02390 [Caulifigura coniformis]